MSALLLVETSATMRRVLGEYLRALGYAVTDVASYPEAIAALDARLGRFDADYDGVVFGWPAVADDEADRVLDRLEQDDVTDLPVLVMSTDLRAETRAWVAARSHTAVVAWKRYRDSEALLDSLVRQPVDAGEDPAKFDNRDIRVLVVDDSATIRRSLRDLLSQQGYRAVLAPDAKLALTIARDEPVDIAIVDFYLGDDTGDTLCRDLVNDAATGDVVCAVLTGTYSDHIIRRSLRAGALECLFKNESSELILNRVDALSRFVRQRRRLAEERQLLDSVVNLIAGPALVLDHDLTLRHVSQQALTTLGYAKADTVLQRPLRLLLDDETSEFAPHATQAVWRRADGSSLQTELRCSELDDKRGFVVQLVVEPTSRVVRHEASRVTTASVSTATPSIRPRVEFPPAASSFLSLLTRVLDGREPTDHQASLLVLRLSLRHEGESLEALGDDPEEEPALTAQLARVYRRQGHSAPLGDGRVGFLLHHQDEPTAWMMTRKIMQLSQKLPVTKPGAQVCCTASLKRVDDESREAGRIMALTLSALEHADTLGPDRAVLIDAKRLLTLEDAPRQ